MRFSKAVGGLRHSALESIHCILSEGFDVNPLILK